MAAPLKERLHTGQVVLRIAQVKHGVEVDAFNTATQQVERWQAQRAIVALPIFVAARVVQDAPEFLRHAASSTVYAPWLVANIHIGKPLHDRPGAPPSWDNVLYDKHPSATGVGTVAHGGLGYVDATHQALLPVPGATVLTHYRALGDVVRTGGNGAGVGDATAGRRLLQDTSWSTWRDQILADLSMAHSDLREKTTRIDITRYGHAMAVPVPRINGQIGLKGRQNVRKQLSKAEQNSLAHGRLTFAHSDWAGYSVFEEAFTLGHNAGL